MREEQNGFTSAVVVDSEEINLSEASICRSTTASRVDRTLELSSLGASRSMP